MQKLEAEDTIFKRKNSISTGGKLLDFDTPKVMGILNITPDSFYSESRVNDTAEILKKAGKMLDDGAEILDLGGYSSRPGASDISPQEEADRVIPAIEVILKNFPEAIISIDTFRAEVAEKAIQVGAGIINDISGFSQDPRLPEVAAKYKTPYILMHMRGTPQNMQSQTNYDNLLTEMAAYFSEKIAVLKNAGVKDIILDPGFGFSKTLEDNHFLLKNVDYFDFLGHPILVGVSRKSMIYKKLGISAEESLPGTIALNAIALNKGASILRVHDVKEAVELIRLLK